MKKSHKHLSQTAILVSVIALTGCASGSGSTGTSLGSRGGDDGSTDGNPITAKSTPLGVIADNTGNLITEVGDTVAGSGPMLRSLRLPLLSTQTQDDLSDTTSNAGGILKSLGTGVSSGLGQTGIVDDPVGITVASLSDVVNQAGETIQSAGTLISNLGSDNLSPLAPVTQPVGSVVQGLGDAVSDASQPLDSVLESPPVKLLLRSASRAVVPVTSDATTLTQQVGATTQLGSPINDLLTSTGDAVASLGDNLSASGTPVVGDLGGVVSAVGNTVGISGILLHSNGSDNAEELPATLTRLLEANSQENTQAPIVGDLNNLLNSSGNTVGLPGVSRQENGSESSNATDLLAGLSNIFKPTTQTTSVNAITDDSNNIVTTIADSVSGVGRGHLSPLTQVTEPVGQLIHVVGNNVPELPQPLNSTLTTGTVEKVIRTASTIIVPLTSGVTTITQQVGAATQLGSPVNDLLNMTGGEIDKLGSNLGDSDGPLARDIGGAISVIGNTVGGAGVLVHNASSGPSNSRNLLTSLTKLSSPIGNSNPISSLSNTVGERPGVAFNNAVNNSGINNIVSPITTSIGALTTTVGNNTNSGNQQGVLQPVINLLGGLIPKK